MKRGSSHPVHPVMTLPSGEQVKQCLHCNEIKPIGEFGVHPPYGRVNARCKACRTTVTREKYQRSPRKHAQVKELKGWDQKRRTFGITREEYEQREALQGGVCAICGQPEIARPASPNSKRTTRRLAIDHDHETGCLRGLLCIRCNVGLSAFHDEPERLAKALNYLLEWRDVHVGAGTKTAAGDTAIEAVHARGPAGGVDDEPHPAARDTIDAEVCQARTGARDGEGGLDA